MTRPITAGKTPRIAWKEFYSVGDRHLDRQHQELLSLINRLHEAFGRGEEQDALPSIARRLADYTSTHFRDEERAMEDVGFPDIQQHRCAHKEYTEETADFLYACIQGNPPEAHQILQFLKYWWIDHISNADKQYAPFLDNRESETSDKPDEPIVNRELDELFEALIENEQALSRYYAAMSNFLPADATTWDLLSLQEVRHAQAFREIQHTARQDPCRFAVGKFNAAPIRVTTREIQGMIGKIERREVHPNYAVTFAVDLEQSLIESELDKALETDVIEVRNSLRRLVEETVSHREILRAISM